MNLASTKTAPSEKTRTGKGTLTDAMTLAMTLIIHSTDDLLTAVVSGPFSLVEANRTFEEILEAAVQSQASKVLFDGRGITGDIERVERFYYGMFAAESVNDVFAKRLRRPPRFAYVLNPPILHEERLGELVAQSQGMIVKAFPRLEPAQAWLNAERADEP
jgi:hypothetical protein